jgi:acyltransferase-like protein
MGLGARLRQVKRAGGFVALTAGVTPAFFIHRARVPASELESVRQLWARRWARALIGLFDVETVIEGNVPPPTRPGERGRLIVSNHRSAIDIGVLLATFGGRIVSRADLGRWPLVGAAARHAGTVFVDRTSAKSGAATIRVSSRARRSRSSPKGRPSTATRSDPSTAARSSRPSEQERRSSRSASRTRAGPARRSSTRRSWRTSHAWRRARRRGWSCAPANRSCRKDG